MELHSHPATDLFSTIDVSTIDVSFGRVVTVADANVPLRLDNRELTNDKRKIKNQKILIMEDNEEMKLKKKKKRRKNLYLAFLVARARRVWRRMGSRWLYVDLNDL